MNRKKYLLLLCAVALVGCDGIPEEKPQAQTPFAKKHVCPLGCPDVWEVQIDGVKYLVCENACIIPKQTATPEAAK